MFHYWQSFSKNLAEDIFPFLPSTQLCLRSDSLCKAES